MCANLMLLLPLYSLGFNDIGAEGAHAIAEALEHNKILTELQCVYGG
jgi:hypothetical protein